LVTSWYECKTYFTSILETRNREALRLTEVGAGLDGHVVTGDGSTSEQSTVDFLNTSSVGVCARRRSLEVRVGVDLESVGSSTSGRGRASTWGNTLSASARERSPVGQSIGAITLDISSRSHPKLCCGLTSRPYSIPAYLLSPQKARHFWMVMSSEAVDFLVKARPETSCIQVVEDQPAGRATVWVVRSLLRPAALDLVET
jgi:hypothetical protein